MTGRHPSGTWRLARACAHRWASQSRDESGQGVIELLLAVMVMVIAMAMTIVIVTSLTNSAKGTFNLSTSTNTAQAAVAQLEQYIRGTVSPASAVSASCLAGSSKSMGTATECGSSPVTLASTDTSPCWGAAQPNQTTNALGGPGQLSNPPQTVGIITAHDFDFEFCGYPINATTPHVYRAWINPATCRNPTPIGPTSAGYCTLQIDDYTTGPSCTGTPIVCTSTNSYNSATPVSTVYTLKNVWCDQYCQNAYTGTGNVANYTTTGYPASVALNSLACSDYATAPSAGCTNATPPLFTYYGGVGTATPTSANAKQVPLNDVYSAAVDGSSNPYSNPTVLPAIQSVVLTITVLANADPNIPAPGGQPGTTITSKIFLPNVTGQL